MKSFYTEKHAATYNRVWKTFSQKTLAAATTALDVEALHLRALRIREQQLGSEHPETVDIMHGLAQLREAQGNLDKARTWYRRALEIYEQALGTQHPKTRETRQRFISLLQIIER